MGTAMKISISATLGHRGLFLLVAWIPWEKGCRQKTWTPISIPPSVWESPDQGLF